MTEFKKNKNYAIGVFDSGLGGLTVVKELMKILPREDIVYFGDTARVPYGTKSKESIIKFSKENVMCLLEHKVKMIVIACNSSSSLALATLKRLFPLPILGVINPGARKAVSLTKNKKVGVIGTQATIKSRAYTKNIKHLNRSIKVTSQACPLFVPLAEEGWFNGKVTREIAQKYLHSLKTAKVDTLILGCTHYPLLKATIQKVMGSNVCLIDSAKEVALEVKELLDKMNIRRTAPKSRRCLFLVSDQPDHFRRLAGRFLGYGIQEVKRATLG